MGVSIQVYRCRIGNFNVSAHCRTRRSPTCSATPSQFPGCCWAVYLLILLLSFQLLQHQKPHLSSHNSKQNSTKSGATSSILQAGSWSSSSISSRGSWPDLSTPTISGQVQGNSFNVDKLFLTKKMINFLARMLHGNRSQRGHGIKLIHWNKGPSFLTNKHEEIEAIVANNTPHILGLSEANLKSEHDQSLVQHQDYILHTCDTINNPQLGISRIVVYSHKSLVVKRRRDLEDNTVSAIWLEIGLPRQKKILHCQAYREWQHLGQGDDFSGSIAAQLQRWELFLAKWELALMEGKEVVVMMDANIDFLKWCRDDLPASDSTKKLKPLIKLLFDKIFPYGVSQLVKTATRTWPGQTDSGLDHIYSNKPEKLSEVHSEFMGGSDHRLLKIVRFSKSLKRSARYVRKRCFKNFNPEEFIQAVKQLSWYDLYLCQDVNQASQMLSSKLGNILDVMAPIKTIQIRTNYAPWLSDSTKKLLNERNAAQKVASSSRDPDDWRYYKHLRNTATARMRQEKKTWETSKLSNTEHDSGTLWKNVKSFLGWNISGPPSQLFHNGQFENSPAGLARTMNNFFIDKVAQLRQRIPQVDLDPLAKLRETLSSRVCTFQFKPVEPDEVMQIYLV